MDAKQKYTEEKFEIDELFLEQINNFKFGGKNKIADLVDQLDFKITDGLLQNLTGHVTDESKSVVYFMIDYYKFNTGPAVLLDINSISSDEYLDSINLNINIKCA
tara:strand:- start:2339 stop:2653 length:315 start_codon:yes stop_codon:yes gene_type:complete